MPGISLWHLLQGSCPAMRSKARQPVSAAEIASNYMKLQSELSVRCFDLHVVRSQVQTKRIQALQAPLVAASSSSAHCLQRARLSTNDWKKQLARLSCTQVLMRIDTQAKKGDNSMHLPERQSQFAAQIDRFTLTSSNFWSAPMCLNLRSARTSLTPYALNNQE